MTVLKIAMILLLSAGTVAACAPPNVSDIEGAN